MAGRARQGNHRTPAWLPLLEQHLQILRENRRLRHEEGQGAPCLTCSKCPGLDPHFWRKTCKNCKCRTEEHDFVNDCTKYEVLLYEPPRPLDGQFGGGGLELLINYSADQSKVIKVIDPDDPEVAKFIKFDWVPADISSSMVIEFMNQFDALSIPISGTQGAVRRRTQLKSQIPWTDFDLSVRATLPPSVIAQYDAFLVLARSSFGQGRVIRYSIGVLEAEKGSGTEENAEKSSGTGENAEKSSGTEMNAEKSSGIELIYDTESESDESYESEIELNDELAIELDVEPEIEVDEEPEIEVAVPPSTKPVMLDANVHYEKHWVDECWKRNFSKFELMDDMEDKEQGTSKLWKANKRNQKKGLEPKEPVGDYDPLVEYKVFLDRVEGINNCTDEQVKSPKVIQCHWNSNFAENRVVYNEVKKCTECNFVIKHGSLAVATQTKHGALGSLWHPKCFVCDICLVPLADLFYFYSDNKVYCGRHFAFWKTNFERCGGCDKLILSGNYTFAEDKCFHVEHFCCKHCDKILADQNYVMKQGHPYCIRCYNICNSKLCKTCDDFIGVHEQGIEIDDGINTGNWHAMHICFKCATCEKSLVGQRVKFHASLPFCSNECISRHAQAEVPQ